MNKLFFSSPLLNTFDVVAAVLFILMATYLFFHFFIARYSGIKRGREIQILSFGYFLSALIILFKVLILNVKGHTLYDKATPVMLALSLQLFIPSLVFIYQKIIKKDIIKSSLMSISVLTIFNFSILHFSAYGFLENAENHKLTSLIISSAIILFVGFVNYLYFKKIQTLISASGVLSSDQKNSLFMFLLTSVFCTLTVLLYYIGVARIYYYLMFFVFIITSMIFVVSSIFILHFKGTDHYTESKDSEVKLKEEIKVSYPLSVKNSGSYWIEHNKIEELKNRLIKYFEDEKPFLKSNLTIHEVSIHLYTNKTYLSRVINESMNKNFNQLLNKYRIEEAKKIFFANQNISMDDLCVQSGFGSMASFSIAFRIYAGTSPSDWCKDQRTKIRNGEMSLA